jgi:hypothetical protein
MGWNVYCVASWKEWERGDDMMHSRVKQADSTAPFLAVVGTVIYVGLIAREIFHFSTKAPWPGFTVLKGRAHLLV